ncbi:MAG: hypothetical protein WC797_00035 [Candidatus Paceibacterota bacterium]|jgi:hypothetical protein
MLKILFRFFRKFEKSLGVKVHFIETGLVFLILSITAILSGKGWVEWVGVFGVVFTFEYQVLSTYLAEHGEARKRIGKHVKSDFIYKEIQLLYYTKEIVWISYFLLLGAYSAIVGTIVFICYGVWRRLYRSEYPLSDEDII